MKIRTTLVASILLLVSVQANAALLAVDAWETGDGKLTRDTETGLDWLDLSITNGLSVNDILVDNYGGLLDYGFQWATTDDVLTLFMNAGAIMDLSKPRIGNSIGWDSSNYLASLLITDLLGCTTSKSFCASGPSATIYYSQGWQHIINGYGGTTDKAGFASGAVREYSGIDEGKVSVQEYGVNYDWSQWGTGIFLYRTTPTSGELLSGPVLDARWRASPPPIPIPAAVWLFGTALVGLVGFGKRRKAV